MLLKKVMKVIKIKKIKKNSLILSIAAVIIIGTVACGTNSKNATNNNLADNSQANEENTSEDYHMTVSQDNLAMEIWTSEDDESIPESQNALVLKITLDDGSEKSIQLTDMNKEVVTGPVVDYEFIENNGQTYFAFSISYGVDSVATKLGVGHLEDNDVVWDLILKDPGYSDYAVIFDCTQTASFDFRNLDGKEIYKGTNNNDYLKTVEKYVNPYGIKVFMSEGEGFTDSFVRIDI